MDAIVYIPQSSCAGVGHSIIIPSRFNPNALPSHVGAFLVFGNHGMTNITYIEASGQSTTLNLPDGWSLMQGATSNGVDGILGECGGSCACATCHCYVDEARLGELPIPSEGELAMLESVVAECRPNSRLACQIKSTAALEGLIIHLPELQE